MSTVRGRDHLDIGRSTSRRLLGACQLTRDPAARLGQNCAVEPVDYTETFIVCSDDCPAVEGEIPPSAESIAGRTWQMIADQPYRYTSGDVIFTVYADRQDIPQQKRPTARREFYAKGRACLRSSDLGRRYGWGIHADSDGRLAVYGIGTSRYDALAEGRGPKGAPVKVVKAMRRSRANPGS